MALPFGVLLLSTFSFVSSVHAYAFPGAVPTAIIGIEDYGRGFSPKPTDGPQINAFDLRKRQEADLNTCGWIDGDPSQAITCRPGRTCMLYTPSNVIGMAGCCTNDDSQACGWRNSCVGYSDMAASCNDGCVGNTFVMQCTDRSAPFCISWTYPADRIEDYGCDATDSASTWQTILQSASGGEFINLPYLPDAAVTGWEASTPSSAEPSTTEPPSSSTESETPTNEPTTAPAGKKSNTGAIVGGVVGGLAGLAAIVGFIVFFLFRRKKQGKPAAAAPVAAAGYPQQSPNNQPPMAQQQQPGMHPQSGYFPPPPPGQPDIYNQPPQHQYMPPTYDQKLSPNPQMYAPPASTSPVGSNASPVHGWGIQQNQQVASPQPELRPTSQAWSMATAPNTHEISGDQQQQQHAYYKTSPLSPQLGPTGQPVSPGAPVSPPVQPQGHQPQGQPVYEMS